MGDSYDSVIQTVSNYIYNNQELDIKLRDILRSFGLEEHQALCILRDLIKKGEVFEKGGIYTSKPPEEEKPKEEKKEVFQEIEEKPEEEKKPSKKSTRLTQEEKDEILKLYTKDNLTIEQVAREMSRSYAAVYNIIRHNKEEKEEEPEEKPKTKPKPKREEAMTELETSISITMEGEDLEFKGNITKEQAIEVIKKLYSD